MYLQVAVGTLPNEAIQLFHEFNERYEDVLEAEPEQLLEGNKTFHHSLSVITSEIVPVQETKDIGVCTMHFLATIKLFFGIKIQEITI